MEVFKIRDPDTGLFLQKTNWAYSWSTMGHQYANHREAKLAIDRFLLTSPYGERRTRFEIVQFTLDVKSSKAISFPDLTPVYNLMHAYKRHRVGMLHSRFNEFVYRKYLQKKKPKYIIEVNYPETKNNLMDLGINGFSASYYDCCFVCVYDDATLVKIKLADVGLLYGWSVDTGEEIIFDEA